MTQTIAAATTIGEVELYVADLDRALRLYQDGIGFKLLSQGNGEAVLGAGSRRLLTLIEKPGARHVPKTTGLYHFAVRLPGRHALAELLYHLAESEIPVEGASDHGVSEALYLTDPDGNGIELYRDRPRAEWPVDDLGKIQMDVEALDVDDLVMTLKDGVPVWQGLPDQTVIGHVHLHVRDLLEAERFYTRVLGFQLMLRYESGAIFVSAGGYHHHIGLNTWAGAGAPPPPPDAAGLRWFEVILPDPPALQAVLGRLQEAGVPSEARNGGVLVHDPSQNGILLRAEAHPPDAP
jgi:catechol 2,3-dioxygenase